jgi:hypothetical protein
MRQLAASRPRPSSQTSKALLGRSLLLGEGIAYGTGKLAAAIGRDHDAADVTLDKR